MILLIVHVVTESKQKRIIELIDIKGSDVILINIQLKDRESR